VTPGGGTIKASFLELNGDTVTQGWQSGGPVVGVLDPDALSCSYDQPCPVLGVTNHLSVPYVYNWNANMEQSLWRNAALTAAYVGIRAIGSTAFAISIKMSITTTRKATNSPDVHT
jgi:hypothetical protein